MDAIPKSNQPITVFYSYAREDKSLMVKLEKHLRLLKTQGYIAAWSEQDVKPGQERRKEINKKLLSADIILLLVSANFMATNYCESSEVELAMQRHEAGEAWVIPILVRAVDWETSSIGTLQALPFTLKPVANWSDRDSAFTEISKNIRNVVMELQGTKNNAQDAMEDRQGASERTDNKSRRKKRRNLYKTIARDYSIGVRIQHHIRLAGRFFSFKAANRRSKGFSLLLLFLFSIRELIALPFMVSQWSGSPSVVPITFAVSLLLFVMGITGKNNVIAAVITFVYCVIWTLVGSVYLSPTYHLHLTFLSALLISVLLSCFQLVLFHSRSPRRRRLPFFPQDSV
ncbi:MAG TPA: toll/interleukin-1 receptor domain-containing protein [Ktedonosporobacter sp.]|jgi:hypothetical protein|nr:toll/interleukin-1 receptor domain-containing protein [Ktedonosporobacter sp.]